MTMIDSIRELRGNIAPPRDLWPAIHARLARENGVAINLPESPGVRAFSHKRVWAVAAAIFALAIGLTIGLKLSVTGDRAVPGTAVNADISRVLQVSRVTDPRYLKERAALIASLDQRLETLPPKTRTQVAMSLATIRKSMSDIQAALGRDPGNALLQELLVNNYQDEMRVLAAVHEAGNSGEEI